MVNGDELLLLSDPLCRFSRVCVMLQVSRRLVSMYSNIQSTWSS